MLPTTETRAETLARRAAENDARRAELQATIDRKVAAAAAYQAATATYHVAREAYLEASRIAGRLENDELRRSTQAALDVEFAAARALWTAALPR